MASVQDIPQPRRWPARAAYAAVCVAVLLASAWALARRVQDPAWPAAAAALAGRVGADEAVVLLPAAARLEARHFDGVPVLAGTPEGLGRVAGLWVVAGPEDDAATLDALAARYREVTRDPHDRFALVHLRAPMAAVFDLVERFRAAEVERVHPDGRVEACPRLEKGKRDCGGLWWRDVGPHTAPFAGEKLRGIWFHPVEGWTTVLRYPDLPPATRAVVRLALDDDARRVRTSPAVGPIRVVVRWGAVERSLALWPQAGFTSVVLDAPDAGAQTLVVEATAAEDHFANLFVFGELLR